MATPAHQRLEEHFAQAAEGRPRGPGEPAPIFDPRLQQRFDFLKQTEAPRSVREIAAALVEHGRALGRTEASRVMLSGFRQRLSDLLSEAVERFPHTEMENVTLEQWREARQFLFSRLQQWHDEGIPVGDLPRPPSPGDAQKMLRELLETAMRSSSPVKPARADRVVGKIANAMIEIVEVMKDGAEMLDRSLKRRHPLRTISDPSGAERRRLINDLIQEPCLTGNIEQRFQWIKLASEPDALPWALRDMIRESNPEFPS